MFKQVVDFPVSSILLKLEEFRQETKYSDVSVLIEGRTYKCHRVILAAASSYFDSMFCGNFRESYVQEFVLKDVDPESFELVLQSLYEGKLNITEVNVFNLLRTSEFLSMKSIQDVCVEYILSHRYSIENVIEIFLWARTLHFLPLMDPLLKCISHNFIRLSESEAFLEMPFDALRDVLTHRPIQLRSLFRLDDLFMDALIRWLHHNYTERKNYVETLDAMIPFAEISVEYSEFLLRKYKINYPLPEKQDTGSSKNESFLKTFIRLYDECYLNSDLLTVSFANNQFSTSDLSLHFYVGRTVISMNKYKPDGIITHVRDRSISSDGIVTLITSNNSNYLYCLKKQDRDLRKFCAYSSLDLSESNSRNLCPPPVHAEVESAVLHEKSNSIYIANGGHNGRNSMYSTNYNLFNDEEIRRGIFYYRCELDKWFSVSQMRRREEIYVQLTCNDDLVYLFSDDGSLQAYDVRSSRCDQLPSTGSRCYNFNCCVLDDKIYVSNGDNLKIFDLTAQQWRIVNYDISEGLRTKMSYNQMVPYENMLWVFGMQFDCLNFETQGYEWNMIIQVFDPKTRKWHASFGSTILAKCDQKLSVLDNVIVFKSK